MTQASSEAALIIRAFLAEQQLWHSALSEDDVPFRVALAPYELPPGWQEALGAVGRDLLAFLAALNDLYREAERRPEWAFVRAWLDTGKDETVLSLGRMRRLRRELPVLIRPDLLRVDGRFVATEIDAVPGGFGIVAALQEAYAAQGYAVLGGPHGIVEGFSRAMAFLSGRADPVVAIAVSDESADYRREMDYLAAACRRQGHAVEALHPRELAFSEEGLFLPDGRRIDVLYRFFELFDWKNVPKAELIWYAYKKERVAVTPPVKAYLEEKSAFALAHHPLLAPFWQERLGDAYDRLRELFPPTWVVDHRPAPPQAFLYGLDIAGAPVQDFAQLAGLSQRERSRWVLKPSGFSPLAWGAHGVRVGEDLSQEAWSAALAGALAASRNGGTPWCLQAYRKPERTEVLFLGAADDQPQRLSGRARISPYFFRTGEDRLELAGVLVTVCPADKKVIHGMVDGVVAPLAASAGQTGPLVV